MTRDQFDQIWYATPYSLDEVQRTGEVRQVRPGELAIRDEATLSAEPLSPVELKGDLDGDSGMPWPIVRVKDEYIE